MSTNEIDAIVMTGDLTKLNEQQRLVHYKNVCDFMEIDPRTQPLAYINCDDPNGGRRLILYALRAATDQIRRNKKIKITKLYKELTEDVVTYFCEGEDKDNITEISTGSIAVKGKRGADLANAFMAAETKAKRRMTLAFSGSGLLDETEIADINAPMSLPAGTGVTAAPNVTVPTVNNSSGIEVTPIEVPGPIPGPAVETGRLNEPPAETPKQKSERVRTEASKSLKEKSKNAPIIETQTAPDKHECPNGDHQICTDKALADIEALSVKQKQTENIVTAKVDLDPVKSKPVQGTLIETAPTKEPEKTEIPEESVSITEDTKDLIGARIVTYKRDILPQGGMRPAKGLGINSKLIKYFLTKFPERKKMDDFTMAELSIVLKILDDAVVAGGSEAAVKLIDEALGTK